MRSPLSFCRGDEATTTWGMDPWQHDSVPMRSPNQGEELRDDSLGFSPDCTSMFVKVEFGVGLIDDKGVVPLVVRFEAGVIQQDRVRPTTRPQIILQT